MMCRVAVKLFRHLLISKSSVFFVQKDENQPGDSVSLLNYMNILVVISRYMTIFPLFALTNGVSFIPTAFY